MSSKLFLAKDEDQCEEDHGLLNREITCPDPDGECRAIEISYSGNDDDLNDDTKSFLGEYDYVAKSSKTGASLYRRKFELKISSGGTHRDFAYLVKIGVEKNWETNESWKVVRGFPVEKNDANTEIKSDDCKEENVLNCKGNWKIKAKNVVNGRKRTGNWIGKGITVKCGDPLLSTGSIIGIVAGFVVLIAIIAIIVVLVVKKKRKDGKFANSQKANSGNM